MKESFLPRFFFLILIFTQMKESFLPRFHGRSKEEVWYLCSN
jgi:hypothetical protein